MARHRRWAMAAALAAAGVSGFLPGFHRVAPAHACYMTMFESAIVPALLDQSTVVAIGTIRASNQPFTTFDVREYYKKPGALPASLIVNNLDEQTDESCRTIARYTPRWAEDTQVLLFLQPDNGESGARWTPIIPQAAVALATAPSGVDALRTALRGAGTRTEPDWSAPAEAPDAARRPACFHDALTLPNLARAAELGVRATVTRVESGVATLRVAALLKGEGATAASEIKVDNGRFWGGLTECAERRLEGSPPRLDVGMDIVALLRPADAASGAAWRPSGIDGAGIYLVDPPESFDSGQLQALPEPHAASLDAVRATGGAHVPSSGPAPRAAPATGSSASRWAGVAGAVALLMGATALAIRQARAP